MSVINGQFVMDIKQISHGNFDPTAHSYQNINGINPRNLQDVRTTYGPTVSTPDTRLPQQYGLKRKMDYVTQVGDAANAGSHGIVEYAQQKPGQPLLENLPQLIGTPVPPQAVSKAGILIGPASDLSGYEVDGTILVRNVQKKQYVGTNTFGRGSNAVLNPDPQNQQGFYINIPPHQYNNETIGTSARLDRLKAHGVLPK